MGLPSQHCDSHCFDVQHGPLRLPDIERERAQTRLSSRITSSVVKRFSCWRSAIEAIDDSVDASCGTREVMLRASHGWAILGKLDRGCVELNACFT